MSAHRAEGCVGNAEDARDRRLARRDDGDDPGCPGAVQQAGGIGGDGARNRAIWVAGGIRQGRAGWAEAANEIPALRPPLRVGEIRRSGGAGNPGVPGGVERQGPAGIGGFASQVAAPHCRAAIGFELEHESIGGRRQVRGGGTGQGRLIRAGSRGKQRVGSRTGDVGVAGRVDGDVRCAIGGVGIGRLPDSKSAPRKSGRKAPSRRR